MGITVFPITASAAYTTPATVTEDYVSMKFDYLAVLLEGKYFTTTQKACGCNENS